MFNKLLNKACHYLLIVTKFCDCYMQVKDNEIVDSGSLQGDRICYIQVTAINMQVNLTVNIRDNFWEVVQ